MPTKSLEQKKAWENRYQMGQTGWDRGAINPAPLPILDNGILTPCRLLIPGCGRGYEVALLAERGFDITAVDIAPSAIRAVRGLLAQHGLSATIIEADFLKWTPATLFDAIYEQTSLCALHPDNWQTYANQLRAWLVPGGHLVANFLQTDQSGGPPFHCAMDEMKTLFPKNLWKWPDSLPQHIEHPSGRHELGVVLVRV